MINQFNPTFYLNIKSHVKYCHMKRTYSMRHVFEYSKIDNESFDMQVSEEITGKWWICPWILQVRASLIFYFFSFWRNRRCILPRPEKILYILLTKTFFILVTNTCNYNSAQKCLIIQHVYITTSLNSLYNSSVSNISSESERNLRESVFLFA